MATEEEFREFVTARWHALVRSAYLLTGDRGHAEDLVQGALERAHRRWKRVDDPERYVRRVLVTAAASRWRRVARRPETLTEHLPETAGPDQHARADDRDAVRRALATLPPRTRAVLVLRYVEDLSEADTAALLGCSVGSVKSQASRGLARLRSDLAAPGNDSPAPTPDSLRSLA